MHLLWLYLHSWLVTQLHKCPGCQKVQLSECPSFPTVRFSQLVKCLSCQCPSCVPVFECPSCVPVVQVSKLCTSCPSFSVFNVPVVCVSVRVFHLKCPKCQCPNWHGKDTDIIFQVKLKMNHSPCNLISLL